MYLIRRVGCEQRGISLVEVLVTIVILSFGLLGVAGLLATGLRNNQSSQFRTQASILAYDMAERMRANRQAAIDGKYATANTADGAAASDRTQWTSALAAKLPGGTGSVAMAGVRYFVITVKWDDSKGVGGDAEQQFELRGEL